MERTWNKQTRTLTEFLHSFSSMNSTWIVSDWFMPWLDSVDPEVVDAMAVAMVGMCTVKDAVAVGKLPTKFINT